MAKGYWIGSITVTDPENYPKYIAANKAPLEKFGGKFLVRGGKNEVPEGQSRQRHVVVEFESYDKAVACYFCEEYQAAAKLRQAYGESDIVIVEGYEG